MDVDYEPLMVKLNWYMQRSAIASEGEGAVAIGVTPSMSSCQMCQSVDRSCWRCHTVLQVQAELGGCDANLETACSWQSMSPDQ